MIFIRKTIRLLFGALLFSLLFVSCSKKTGVYDPNSPPPEPGSQTEEAPPQKEEFIDEYWSGAFDAAGLPDSIKKTILARLAEGPDFVMELFSLLDGDPSLCLLVDKRHTLERAYAPEDLVELTDGAYRITRPGLLLRKAAAGSLEAMAIAARADGVILTAASTYRSYDYQENLYARNVREMGKAAADRESAPPGASQHQLGLVVDFYPIDDAFAETTAFLWLKKNAARFGWSLSFPDGYEEITGYRYESWHYRYVGTALADFTNAYFDGIQQYALLFIHYWRKAAHSSGISSLKVFAGAGSKQPARGAFEQVCVSFFMG